MARVVVVAVQMVTVRRGAEPVAVAVVGVPIAPTTRLRWERMPHMLVVRRLARRVLGQTEQMERLAQTAHSTPLGQGQLLLGPVGLVDKALP